MEDLRRIIPRHIRLLPVRAEMLRSSNRGLNNYQAFSIKFTAVFNNLSPAVQHDLLIPHRPTVEEMLTRRNRRIIEEAGDDLEAAAAAGFDDDDNAVLNNRRNLVARRRLSSELWRGYGPKSSPIKKAWKTYAEKLNRLRVPGLVTHLPPSFFSFTVRGATVGGLGLLCMHSMFQEWTSMVALIQNSLVMGYKGGELQRKSYCIGRERVQIAIQIHRQYIKMSLLLRTLLFGNSFEKVRQFIVYETPAKIVLHIHSNQELNRLFTLAGLSAFSFFRDTLAYHGCPKIHLDYDGTEYIGYTMNETVTPTTTGRQLKIRMEDNSFVRMPAPTVFNNLRWNFRTGTYKHNNFLFSQTEYHPIRIVLGKSRNDKICSMSYIMHRCCLNKVDRRIEIDTQLSS